MGAGKVADDGQTNPEKAKAYQRIRHWLTLTGLLLTLGLFAVIFIFHLDDLFFRFSGSAANVYGQLLLFFSLLSLYFFIFSLPLSYYSGFTLEHRYQLSNHTLASWGMDFAKRELLSFALSASLVVGLYGLIWHDPGHWWLWAWGGFTLVQIILGQLFPVFVIPLFYKYQPIQAGGLKTKILELAARFGMRIENIYSLNLSRTTKKANAMFCGIGKTRRIVLGDTLLAHFTDEEIESVLAHEIGHFKNKDMWRQLAFGACVSFVIFWAVNGFITSWLPGFGGQGAADIQALPFLLLVLFLASLIFSPAGNAYSRRRERKADEFALKAVKTNHAFISAMEKLSRTNLADPDPHPLIEFFLYDHPAIKKRIAMARRMARRFS